MATQSKFNTVLPANTIQQGLIYSPISSIYANSINTLGQAENVMTANDVELSLNTWSAGSTASINIPASYKLLGNMYLKMTVKLSTLLLAPQPEDTATYHDLYRDFNGNGITFANTPSQIKVIDSNNDATTADRAVPFVTRNVGVGTLNTGLPLDVNFLAYNLIKQLTWRIPGCDRLYIQGIRMLPTILDKCPNDEEKQKIAMMAGTGHHLYSYNMTKGTSRTLITQLKKPKNILDVNPLVIGNKQFIDDFQEHCPTISVNRIDDPEFVIYALLDLPWSTVDKEKSGLYYPSHMTTSALELNIQFQDSQYMRVPAEDGYSGYKVDILSASLRFTYAAVATMTYYKPPIYKLPCSLHYDFEFPVEKFDSSADCRTNLLGLKNGEITQLLMFIHQAEGGTANNVLALSEISKGASMRFKWRNEPLKNVQVEYAGQIIWKGSEDGYDFMNQFDNRKSWSAFKLPALISMKSVAGVDSQLHLGPGKMPYYLTPEPIVGFPNSQRWHNLDDVNPAVHYTFAGLEQNYGAYEDISSAYVLGSLDNYTDAQWPFKNASAATANLYFKYAGSLPQYQNQTKTAVSNGYDVSAMPMFGVSPRDQYYRKFVNAVQAAYPGEDSVERHMGSDLYKRSILDGPLFPSSGYLPFTKVTRWHTPSAPVYYYETENLKDKPYTDSMLQYNTTYHYSDCFHWTVVPVAEKIDQIRGPRDYALGADFKDSNLIVKFSGYDALKSSAQNSFVESASKDIRWNLHVVVSITSAFIFNGDKADLMQ